MVVPPITHRQVWRELPDAPEPLRAFEALRARPGAWLLDSASRSVRLGRYSFAGADPWARLSVRGAEVVFEVLHPAHPEHSLGRRSIVGDPVAGARALVGRAPKGDGPPLPFAGGAVAAVGYGFSQHTLPVAPRGAAPGEPADLTLLGADRLIGWDHETGRAYLCGLVFGDGTAAAEARLDEFAAWLERPAAAPRAGGSVQRPAAVSLDREAHGKAVDEIVQQIAAGNVYQANLTTRFERPFGGDPWQLYRALRRINPAPFACYLELPERVVVGSSPERFLRVTQKGVVESRPIKGTRPRGRHQAEDAALRAELAASEKDRAENLMIVDLVRNDLGRVCETGSVAVPELFAIEEYATVFQLVSSVTGRLRADRDVLDLLVAAFPPGSMTGAPKIAAVRLLERLEPVPRGLYAGCVGYLDARGSADLSVVIRTLFARDGAVALHSGGGIVADSDRDAEWREALDKARALREALAETDGSGG